MPAKDEDSVIDFSSTRNRIIDAALEVFALKGFKGATTKEIAKRARVNEVTLFRLFKSKKALFAAAIQERLPLAEIERRMTFDTQRPINDVLFENIKTVLGVVRANKHLYMLMLGESWRQTKSRDSPLMQPLNAALDYVSSFLQAQMDAGRLAKTDSRLCSMALMGSVQFYFMNTYVMSNVRTNEGEEDRTLRRLVELFLNGMGPKEGGS
jgi:AcrR family transcriptional regulator